MVQGCLEVRSDPLRDPTMQPSLKPSSPSFSDGKLDQVHFPVGVELKHEDLGDRTNIYSTSSSSPVFHRSIMHRAVSARSFLAHVQYDASAATIAAAVGAPEQDVENLWLAGVRTPAKRKVDRRALNSKDASMKFTPQSVLDCPIISGETEVSAPEPEQVCEQSGLDQTQFADLFREDTEIDQECLELGNALIGKLEELAGTCRAFPIYQPPTRPTRRRSMRTRSLGSTSDLSVPLKAETTGSQSEEARRKCGFSQRGSHPDLELKCDGFAICKTRQGLYRTAKGISSTKLTAEHDDEESYYFEVVIVDDRDSGGICVGVSTESLGLNKLVGSNSESCGLHSSGQIVIENGEFRPFGKSFAKGDRVGCMVTLHPIAHHNDPRAPQPSQNGSYSGSDDDSGDVFKEFDDEVELKFFVNGECQGSVRAALWRNVPADKRRLFPVVSLYKKDSKAVMQCCPKDWALSSNDVDYEVKAFCCNRL